MDVEQRAREPNPNVQVIETARDSFPKDHYMYAALDHAAAELAVLHGRCQRAALTPPEGYVLVEEKIFDSIREFVTGFHGMSRNNAENLAAELLEELNAARPEVP